MRKRNESAISHTINEEQGNKHLSMRHLIAGLLILVFIPTVIAVGMLAWGDRHYYIVSILIIMAALVPFAMLFEKRKPRTRELVLIAVMTTLGVVGRAAFYMLPQFKPVTAIVIITGVSLGSEAGFATGALTAFVSNIFFGQGPWTPWQMFAFGIIGFLSGVLFSDNNNKIVNLPLLLVFGALATFAIYGGIMDTSSLFMMSSEISWSALLAMFASGFVMNLIHAASTVVFLLVLSKPLLKKLRRIRIKYGMME